MKCVCMVEDISSFSMPETERNDLLMNEKVPLTRLTHARAGFNLITNYHAWIQHNLDFMVF